MEPPPKLDGREQRLHPGLPAEWQREEAREVALEVRVAREQLIELPVVTERVELATGGDGRTQGFLVMRLVELLKSGLARGPLVQEDVHRLQHGRKRLGDVLAHLAMARLNRVACTPRHAC